MSDWSPEWPTEPGWYWFYGQSAYEVRREKSKRLCPVRVRVIRDTVTYASGHELMWENEGYVGVWQRIPEPEVPDV